jgi:hypothetical protein
MVHFSLHNIRMIPLAVAALLGGVSATSFATPVTYGNTTLDAEYKLDGGSLVNGMTDPSTYITNYGNGADLYLSKSSSLGSNVFFHTYGYSSYATYFGARASGEGNFYAKTSSTFSQIYTNNTGSAQNYTFNFEIASGQVGLNGTGNGFAQLLLNIKRDGTSVAQDFTRVDLAGNTATCTDTDVGLDPYMSCGSSSSNDVFGSGGLYSVNMGTLAAGESFTLDYDIIATVSAELTSSSYTYYQACNSGYGELAATRVAAATTNDGYGGPAPDPGQQLCEFHSYFPGSGIARSGDPFNGPQFGLGGPAAYEMAAFSMDVSASDVPEPGSLALVGLAIAGLAATRRKKLAPAS